MTAAFSLPHFLSTQFLTRSQILSLLQHANSYLSPQGELLQPTPTLQHTIIANLFFENSTRTRCAFEISAHRLGAYVLNIDVSRSSTQKGETLLDTVRNLQAMGVKLFVIRHGEAGLPAWLAEQVGNDIAIINAGDGVNEHPSQAMLDLLTIQHYKPDFSQLRIAIVGDIRHSRVAHSLCYALSTVGVPDIRLVGPPQLLPEQPPAAHITLHEDVINGIAETDVIVALRMQTERMTQPQLPVADYFQRYGISSDKLRHAKPDVIVMHPGPMNRDVEIESSVAEGAHSVILAQPKFGIAMRMAILCAVCYENR